MSEIRIITYNVNGINSYNSHIKYKYNKTLNNYFKENLKGDIICIQETKGTRQSLQKFYHLNDYVCFFSFSEGKNCNGKYGVCTFVSKKFYCNGYKSFNSASEVNKYINRHNDDNKSNLDSENIQKNILFDQGRVLLTKHGDFHILNVYFPYIDFEIASEEKINDTKIFYQKVRELIDSYSKVINYEDKNINSKDKKINSEDKNINYEDKKRKEKLIILGDFNATYSLKDSFQYYSEKLRIEKGPNPLEIVKKTFYQPYDLKYSFPSILELKNYFYYQNNFKRKWLKQIIVEKIFIDSFRFFHKHDSNIFTCWNQTYNLREVNKGSRIDLILVQSDLKVFMAKSRVLTYETGSDHCPVYLDLKINDENDKNSEYLNVKGNKNLCISKNNLSSFFKLNNKSPI